jgi:hypothetical protein
MTSALILEIVKEEGGFGVEVVDTFWKAPQAKAGVQGAQPLEKKQPLLKFENRI